MTHSIRFDEPAHQQLIVLPSKTGALGWLVLGLLAIVALVSTSVITPARADTVERPEKPDFLSVYTQLVGPFSAYKSCVDEKSAKAIATMWEREAPIAASIYDIGHAYRNCEGFAEFWNTIYFLGFDSPEQWIDIELRLIRTAGMQRAETDLAALRGARDWLREAAQRVAKAPRMGNDERRLARRHISRMLYVVETMMPEDGDAELFAELLELRRDDFLSFLPEESEGRLSEVLEFAQGGADPDEAVMRDVKTQMRN